jgi:hypothetical protein
MSKLAPEDHNDQRSENNPTPVDHSIDDSAKELATGNVSKQAQGAADAGRDALPSFDYYLDESDFDIVILRRQDDSFVAAFSASGATKEGIVKAAREDFRELIRVYWERLGQAADDAEFGVEGRDAQLRRTTQPPPQ